MSDHIVPQQHADHADVWELQDRENLHVITEISFT